MPPFPSTLQNHLGERLDFTLHRSPDPRAPLAIIGHGVTGHKDRPLLITVAETLAAHGITALRLSFAGNGASDGRFGESVVTKEVQELGAVIDALGITPVGYIGHSMGAAVGVLRASEDHRIKFLVSLAGIAHTAAFASRQFGAVEAGHGWMWDKPECPLSHAYMDDMKGIGSVVEAARRIRVPWLLVHGSADELVPPTDSRDLHQAAPHSTLKEVEGADHRFSDAYGPPVARDIVQWIKAQLA